MRSRARISGVALACLLAAASAFADDDVPSTQPGKDGKLPPVGNTVNVVNARYTNAIGAPYLAAHWKDPAFDPRLRAFYYVRALEIPTPRWTTYDAKFFKVAAAEGRAGVDPGTRQLVADLVHAGRLKQRGAPAMPMRRTH